jgi:methylenetetrahydrofolate dehydrogenase (NADP+)/methenyltetrahydrofolate cyclohydrolase
LLSRLNYDTRVHGILIQQPFNVEEEEMSQRLVEHVDPIKDVDGLNPRNVARLVCGDVSLAIAPCTPSGIIRLLDYYGNFT